MPRTPRATRRRQGASSRYMQRTSDALVSISGLWARHVSPTCNRDESGHLPTILPQGIESHSSLATLPVCCTWCETSVRLTPPRESLPVVKPRHQEASVPSGGRAQCGQVMSPAVKCRARRSLSVENTCEKYTRHIPGRGAINEQRRIPVITIRTFLQITARSASKRRPKPA